MRDHRRQDPWPEELVTSPAQQQIGALHDQLDQLMAQANLIAAYMPPHPVIATRPVVTLKSSMIVAQKTDEEALQALRQDIADKQKMAQQAPEKQTNEEQINQSQINQGQINQGQADFVAYDQNYKTMASDAHNKHTSAQNQSPSSSPPKQTQKKTEDDNELRALIRAYVIRCLEEEAPQIIHKELLKSLSTELDIAPKRDDET